MALDYLSVNLANWNSRVSFYERGYSLDRFRADPNYLSRVVPGATVADEQGEYRLRERPERLAATYTLKMTKR